jgi:hypothetical protein
MTHLCNIAKKISERPPGHCRNLSPFQPVSHGQDEILDRASAKAVEQAKTKIGQALEKGKKKTLRYNFDNPQPPGHGKIHDSVRQLITEPGHRQKKL